MTRDPRVDEYIAALPPWQRVVCERLRALVHEADPAVEETIKRTVRPYFVLDGNVCALLAAKTHVNLFLDDGAIVPDPDGIITGGHDNSTARTAAFHENDPTTPDARRVPTRLNNQKWHFCTFARPGNDQKWHFCTSGVCR